LISCPFFLHSLSQILFLPLYLSPRPSLRPTYVPLSSLPSSYITNYVSLVLFTFPITHSYPLPFPPYYSIHLRLSECSSRSVMETVAMELDMARGIQLCNAHRTYTGYSILKHSKFRKSSSSYLQ
jgi:hypothetical protein